MDFEWTPEQLAAYEDIVEFARSELCVASPANGEYSINRTTWQRIAEKGLFASFFPERYGGLDSDLMTTVLMLEGLGYGCSDNGLTLAVNGQIWAVQEPTWQFGTDEQKGLWLRPMLAGEAIGAHAMTEPGSGSDTFALATTATRHGNGYVLNGHKTLIGLAPLCDVALTFASTDPPKGRWGVTAFLVDCASDGVRKGQPTHKMGLNTSPTGDLWFEDCWIPESARLGPEGAGASIFTDSMTWERSFILTSHVGSMARQLDEAIAVARKRKRFGKPIGQFESVSDRIADMRLRLELARLLLYKAAWLKSAGEKALLEAALVNLYVAEAFVSSSLDAIRIHGGTGYLTEYGVEKDLRDAVGGVIYSGTSDIQRQVIARLLGI